MHAYGRRVEAFPDPLRLSSFACSQIEAPSVDDMGRLVGERRRLARIIAAAFVAQSGAGSGGRVPAVAVPSPHPGQPAAFEEA